MDQKSKLRRKRGYLRALITRAVNAITSELYSDVTDKFAVGEMVRKMDATFQLVKECDKELEILIVDEEELDGELSGIMEVVDKVTTTKYRYEERFPSATIASMNGSEVGDEREDEESVAEMIAEEVDDVAPAMNRLALSEAGKIENASVDGKTASFGVKLPKIEIQKFNGDACNWQTFWSQFNTAIHSNCRLGNTQKFVYLTSYLVDDALRSVTGLQVNDENYDAAINILRERFGRRDIVLNAHMKKLLSLPQVRSATDTKSLRKLYDVCEIEIRSLESLGVGSTMFSTLLCPVLMNALPEELAFDFQMRRSTSEDVKVSELLQFLRNVIEAKERAALMTTVRREKHSVDGEQRSEHRRRDGGRFGSAAALQTASQRKCMFCDGEHSSFNCEKDAKAKYTKLRNEKRCYVCFGKGHTSTSCDRNDKCKKCGRRHNTSICFSRRREEEPDKCKPLETVVSTTNSSPRGVLLQTATAKLVAKGEPTVRILLDGGSETSFILKELSTRCKLPILNEMPVNVYTFGNEKPTSTVRRTVSVRLRSFVDGKDIAITAAESNIISSAIVLSPDNDIRSEMKRRNLPIAEVVADRNAGNAKLSVLIGSDHYWRIATGRIERLTSTLVAVETVFGWCLQGVSQLCHFVASSVSLHSALDDRLSTQVKAFWTLDSIGIVDDSKTVSRKENEIISNFNDTVQFVHDRYTVQLPRNERMKELASNYDVAKKRLGYLVKKFEANRDLFKRYKEVVDDQVKDGIAELVSADHVVEPQYYLPHQAVIRDDKISTKLRVVFDASSHGYGKPSLNDCLESGPNLIPDLVAVLLNFRRKKFAYMADIKRAFLQINVDEKDRNLLRFLWFDRTWTPGETVKVNVYRMTRVLFGATCSPFLLAATIKYHISKFKDTMPHVVDRLEKQFYVDDLIGSESTEDDLRWIQKASIDIMSKASMELTKWSTNSSLLSAEWKSKETHLDELPVAADLAGDKVLGLAWNKERDSFSFNVHNILKFVDGKPNTKRIVLKTVSRVFDPLGFIAPFSIRIKILFQRLWEKGLEWDSSMADADERDWRAWLKELSHLHRVNVERCFEDSKTTACEIHIFSDASESAYGCVAFLRSTFEDGSVKSKFIISKSRVAPLKKLSLPRLELMGAVLASRMKLYLEKTFVDAQFYCWTDAMIVIHWIRGSAKKWKPFVANRVSEIHSSTNPEIWRHCSGKQNPADRLTRGIEIEDMIVDKLWWNGPDWLTNNQAYWPLTQIEAKENDVANELRAVFVSSTMTETVDRLFEDKKYSRLERMLRVTAYVQRFVNNLRKEKLSGALTVDEINESLRHWIRVEQLIVYGKEIGSLKVKQKLSNESQLKDFNIFLDEHGLLRAKTRLEHSDICVDSKYPIIIPRESHIATLIIVDAHVRMKHLGVQATLAEVRSTYYIPRGRQLIKTIVRKCIPCRRLNSTHFNEQFAPLPYDRVSSTTPFNVIGVDFAGPLLTRTGKKTYILLITCATTRAVHLELIEDMSTEMTILALKRFISRRGLPATVYSDNGKTFKRVNLELKTLLENIASTKMQEWFSGLRIKWKFIVERSPWWGGFWERMVRTVKSTLKKVLGNASLNFRELSTVLIECEAVINSRPLTYTYDDMNELEPLTPSHFLIGKRITGLPQANNVDEGSERSALLNRWQHRQRVVEHFWRRWHKEYVLQLSWSSSKLNVNSSTKPKPGDVVLVREDNLVRQQWLLAKIVDVIPGRDGRIRACKIKTGKGSFITRPIQRLYPLEVSSTDVDGTSAVSMGGLCNESSTTLLEKSRNFSKLPKGSGNN